MLGSLAKAVIRCSICCHNWMMYLVHHVLAALWALSAMVNCDRVHQHVNAECPTNSGSHDLTGSVPHKRS